ncbi:glycosyltransferase domain-containing protein [Selenomonas sp. ND2010]|uniref:glycosyltransferase domain-containing protein n=1 Tax=Selenomonas sp. ND2010 TaxID=1410618 RepID=UPI00051AC2C0|nr:glycosyltransferase domain-containing protein [Selenomonas sp. ND2010]
MDENKLIEEIERLNADYIEIMNSPEYTCGYKLIELKKRGVWEGIKSLLRRNKFSAIKQNFVNRNLPADIELKLAKFGSIKSKVVVYTCITNGYDKLVSPYIKPDNIDYVQYTDVYCENDVWMCKYIPQEVVKKYNGGMVNRYIKFHPYELFENDYDYAIYVDGNITIISDLSVMTELVNNKVGLAFHKHCTRNCLFDEIEACKILNKGNYSKLKKQSEEYKKEGFPSSYGMIEGNLIVYDLKKDLAKKLTNQLWEELVTSDSGRDQIAWPYVFWKNSIAVNDVATLGDNIYLNPKLRVKSHV